MCYKLEKNLSYWDPDLFKSAEWTPLASGQSRSCSEAPPRDHTDLSCIAWTSFLGDLKK